jgi:hypothetical protein
LISAPFPATTRPHEGKQSWSRRHP